MKLGTLKASLQRHPDREVRLVRPDGEPIPAEFHVTEVGHVARRFIDCGGTVRAAEACLLQAWVADHDREHRLTAGKLAKILELARAIVPSDDLDVEVEHQRGAVAQYRVEGVEIETDALVFTLGHKKTDCLAREACGVEPAAASAGCCGGSGCGCA